VDGRGKTVKSDPATKATTTDRKVDDRGKTVATDRATRATTTDRKVDDRGRIAKSDRATRATTTDRKATDLGRTVASAPATKATATDRDSRATMIGLTSRSESRDSRRTTRSQVLIERRVHRTLSESTSVPTTADRLPSDQRAR
jgi:hypothetical protein